MRNHVGIVIGLVAVCVTACARDPEREGHIERVVIGGGPPLTAKAGNGAGTVPAYQDGHVVSLNADPIRTSANVANGNLLISFAVMHFYGSGAGPQLSMTLHYNSIALAKGDMTTFGLGGGWSGTYSQRLDLLSSDEVRFTEDDGTEVYFARQADGTWTGTRGAFTILTGPLPGGSWTLVNSARTEYHFHEVSATLAVIDEISDASGAAVTVTRDSASSRITRVTDAAGRFLDFLYDPQHGNRLVEVQDPADPAMRKAFFYYGPDGRIQDVNTNQFWVRFVSSQDRITSVRDGDNRFWGFEYDTAGRVRRLQDALPLTTYQELTYNLAGTSPHVLVRDRSAGTWRFDLEKNLHGGGTFERRIKNLTTPGGVVWSTAYDARNLVTSTTDPIGRVWQYTYDANGNTTSVTDPANRIVRTTTYDAIGNPLSTTDALGNTTIRSYDDPDHPTLATSETLPADGQGNPAATTTYTWMPVDAPVGNPGAWNGLPWTVTDPNGVVTEFLYDRDADRLVGNLRYAKTGGDGTGVGRWDFRSWAKGYRRELPVYVPGSGPDTPSSFPPIPNVPGELAAGALTMERAWVPLWNGSPASIETSIESPIGRSTATPPESSERQFAIQYDPLRRITALTLSSTEPGGTSLQRSTTCQVDDTLRQATVSGPDLVGGLPRVRTYQFDSTARLQNLTASGVAGALVSIQRYPDGKAQRRTFRNGASDSFTYDIIGNVENVRHEGPTGQLILQFHYIYRADGTPATVSEEDSTGLIANTSYSYDTRGRVIRETRTGFSPYDLSYTYDQGNNRLTKTDHLADPDRVTSYSYDTTLADFASISHANRLVKSTSIGGTAPTVTTWYYHGRLDYGHVSYVLTKIENDESYHGVRHVYTAHGEPWLVIKEDYRVIDNAVANLSRTEILELRCDGSDRYMVRLRDPNTLAVIGAGEWRDFAELDYQSSGGTTNDLRFHVLRSGEERADGSASYEHHDAAGHVRFTTNQSGSVNSFAVFTAFGELVSGSRRRFGFAGAYTTVEQSVLGHQIGNGYIAMGHRHYDPTTGRFLQTDPIGIAGGLNLFCYVGGGASYRIDPSGLQDSKTYAKQQADKRDAKQKEFDKICAEIKAKGGRLWWEPDPNSPFPPSSLCQAPSEAERKRREARGPFKTFYEQQKEEFDRGDQELELPSDEDFIGPRIPPATRIPVPVAGRLID